MNDVKQVRHLKDKLDAIVEKTKAEVVDGYYASRLKMIIYGWECGEVIDGHFRGVECQPSYYQLERETGYSHHTIKKWHTTYKKNPDMKLFLPIAEAKALSWAQKALGSGEDWYQSSESVEWPTPQWLFDLLDEEFHFTSDVCSTKENSKCKKFYTKQDNGLSKKWTGSCWMNPPYGREISDWMAKARESAEKGATVVCLVPARPDTDWWWDNVLEGEIRFIRGRIKFIGTTSAAPFPSAVIILKKGAVPRKVIWWEVLRKN